MRPATILMLVAVVIIFGIDAYWLATGGFKSTISFSLWDNFHKYPILAILLGVVIGHLTWSITDYISPEDKK